MTTDPLETTKTDQDDDAMARASLSRLAAALPWGISLCFHAAIVLMLVFLVTTISLPTDSILVPVLISDNVKRLPIDRRTPDDPPLRLDTRRRRAAPHGLPRPELKNLMSEVPGRMRTDLALISLPMGPAGGPLGPGRLRTWGDDGGPDMYSVGPPAGENPAKICYVIDRSGSMLENFDYLRAELKRSIGRLSPDQEFHVIFFSTGRPIELPPRRLVPATQLNKRMAFDFLDTIVPRDRTDPAPALERAFAVGPEMMYFMTDGEFDPGVVDKVRQWNRRPQVVINTLAFVYQGGSRLLRQIAADNRGRYKFVTEDMLSR